jgi:glycine cleavage system H protein
MKKVKIKYSPEHNWVELKRKVVTIGLTDYLIGELGDLIDLCLPKVGEEVIDDIPYGEIESINTLYDLIAPLNGEIVKVNSDLATSLKVLQRDPYGDGWFIKVRLPEDYSLDFLMDEDEYEEYAKGIKKKAKEAGKKKKKVEVKNEVEKKAEKKKEKKVEKKKIEKKKIVKKKTVAKSKKR